MAAEHGRYEVMANHVGEPHVGESLRDSQCSSRLGETLLRETRLGETLLRDASLGETRLRGSLLCEALLTVLSLAFLLVSCVGCAGYQLGSRSLYREDVRTIYVPIIRNDTWRPSLGVQLTEQLQKEIQRRTPYRIVNDPSADSILTCRVNNETKRVITENRVDDPRAIDAKVAIQLTWVDRQNMVLMENQFVPPDDVAFLFAEGVEFVPEAGQSISTAHMRAIERLASEIVNQMEVRW